MKIEDRARQIVDIVTARYITERKFMDVATIAGLCEVGEASVRKALQHEYAASRLNHREGFVNRPQSGGLGKATYAPSRWHLSDLLLAQGVKDGSGVTLPEFVGAAIVEADKGIAKVSEWLRTHKATGITNSFGTATHKVRAVREFYDL